MRLASEIACLSMTDRSNEPAADAPARILLVEDDRLIQDMLAEALRGAGFEVALAGSGPQMDAAIRRSHPDLVLLDVMLPGEDGRAICGRLRETWPGLPSFWSQRSARTSTASWGWRSAPTIT